RERAMANAKSQATILDRLGVLCPILMVVGVLLAWLRVVPALAGFALYALGGILATLGLVAGIIQLLRGRGFGAARLIGALSALIFVFTAARRGGVPPINDYTTDMQDPPAFTKAASIPANAGRDLSYPSGFADQQRACCSDLHPVKLNVRPEE